MCIGGGNRFNVVMRPKKPNTQPIYISLTIKTHYVHTPYDVRPLCTFFPVTCANLLSSLCAQTGNSVECDQPRVQTGTTIQATTLSSNLPHQAKKGGHFLCETASLTNITIASL